MEKQVIRPTSEQGLEDKTFGKFGQRMGIQMLNISSVRVDMSTLQSDVNADSLSTIIKGMIESAEKSLNKEQHDARNKADGVRAIRQRIQSASIRSLNEANKINRENEKLESMLEDKIAQTNAESSLLTKISMDHERLSADVASNQAVLEDLDKQVNAQQQEVQRLLKNRSEFLNKIANNQTDSLNTQLMGKREDVYLYCGDSKENNSAAVKGITLRRRRIAGGNECDNILRRLNELRLQLQRHVTEETMDE